MDRTTGGCNGGAPPSSPSSGVVVRPVLLKFEVLAWLYELARVRLMSPYQVIKSITRGVLYSLCWRGNGSKNFQPRAYATMKWNHPEAMDVPQ